MTKKRNAPFKTTDDPIFQRALATRHDDDGCWFFRDDLQPGTAHIHTYEGGNHVLFFICPCGCARANQLAIYTEGQQAHGWKWEGNREQPTLTPSIAMVKRTCQWHGFLKAGVFEEC